MALGLRNVQIAYEVFSELQKTVLPELSIGSIPEDMAQWPNEKREQPETNRVFGFDRKLDGGWESLVFFVENPSKELIERFDSLKGRVGNSPISRLYSRKDGLWIFGWF